VIVNSESLAINVCNDSRGIPESQMPPQKEDGRNRAIIPASVVRSTSHPKRA